MTLHTADPPMELRLFGAFELRVRGIPAPRFRSRAGQWLLALLVLRRGREIDRVWLAAMLWPDSLEEQSLYNLRRNLTDLRRALGPEAGRLISPNPRSLRLDLAGAACDLIAFDDAIAHGGDASLGAAVDLYRGQFLEGCEEEWVYPERAERLDAYLAALEHLASRSTPSKAASHLRRVIATDPLRESAYCRLMEALAAAGDYPAVSQTYRDLRSLLFRELNRDASPHTAALYQRLEAEALKAARGEGAPSESASVHSLPVYLTSFVGRDHETAEVLTGLGESSLVTLTGTGGVGKTRLAVRVADEISGRFPDGAWFVDLSPSSDASIVPEIVAGVLGLYEESGAPWIDILAGSLKSRSILLILDNCEHLLDSCATVSRFLLESCPHLRILATSRQPLGIAGERVLRVPSLSQPPPFLAKDLSVDHLLEYEAVRLFAVQAALHEPGFHLMPWNAEAVVAICRQLDGIPLALELAAARVRGLPISELASRLARDFDMLVSGNREGSLRQRTLRAMIDWSYQTLPTEEQILFQRLSAFSGGWRLEAAEAVCSDEPLSEASVLDLLVSLVNRSLVMMDAETGRYRLLETIRQYADERLRESGRQDHMHDRHLGWCVEYVDEVEAGRDAAHRPDWVQRLGEEHANFRAALDGALRESADQGAGAPAESLVHRGLRLAVRLRRYWVARDLFSEGATLLHAFLDRVGTGGDPRMRAQAWSAVGELAHFQGDYARASSAFDAAMTLYRDLDMGAEGTIVNGLSGVVLCHQGDYARGRALLEEAGPVCERLRRYEGVVILDALAYAVRQQGDYRRARALLERAIALGRITGEVPGQANCLFNLGYVAFEEVDYGEAARRFTSAMNLFQAIGNRTGEARCWCSLGGVAHMQGDQEEALDRLNRALEINRQIGYAVGQAWNFSEIGEVMVSTGRYSEAQSYYEEALRIHREHNCRTNLAGDMAGLAKVTLYLGQYKKSHHWHREALDQMESLGIVLGSVVILESLADLYRVEGRAFPAIQLLSATERRREEMGAAMNAFVRDGRQGHLAELRSAIGVEAFEEAWESGRSMTLRNCIELAHAQGLLEPDLCPEGFTRPR